MSRLFLRPLLAAVVAALLLVTQAVAQTFNPLAWQYLSGATGGPGYITKTSNAYDWNAGGQSWQVLGTGSNGAVRMLPGASSWIEQQFAFGFQVAGDPAQVLSLDQLAFAFVIADNDISIYESGHMIAYVGGFQEGDVLEIRRQNNEISYWVSGDRVLTSGIHTAVALVGGARIPYPGLTIYNLEVNFAQPLSVQKNITHTSCVAQSDNGSVQLTITGGVPPYSVVWSDGGTGAFRDNLGMGTYTATVIDAVNTQQTQTISLRSRTIWGTPAGSGAYVEEDVLYAADGGAAAFSENIVHADEDGHLFWTVPEGVPDVTWGLAQINASPSATTLHFGFQTVGRRGYIWAYGELVADIGEIRTGDELQMIRETQGDGIAYLVNGSLVYLAEVVPEILYATYAVLGKLASTGTLQGPSVDFGCGNFFITLREVPTGTSLKVEGAGINTTLLGENLVAGVAKKLTPTVALSTAGTPITLTLTTPVAGVSRALVMKTTLDRNGRIGRIAMDKTDTEGNLVSVEVPGENISNPTSQSLFIENPGSLVQWGSDLTLCTLGNYLMHTNSGYIAGHPTDATRNWTYSIAYGSNSYPYGSPAQLINESITYFDGLGRVTQVQGKNYTENRILAAQPVYDAFGRAALQTLPAPLPATQCMFGFDAQFMTNAAGQTYSFKDYDLDGTSTLPGMSASNKRDPATVKATSTLGKYYSQTSEEPFLSFTEYPFVRSYASDAGVVWGSGVGESHRLGNTNNNASKSYSFPVLSELDHYVSYRHTYGLGKGTTEATATLAKRAVKQISIDADGNQSVAFYDLAGNLVATCLSSSCATAQPVQQGGSNGCGISQTDEVLLTTQGTDYLDFHGTTTGPSNALFFQIVNGTNPDVTISFIDLATGLPMDFYQNGQLRSSLQVTGNGLRSIGLTYSGFFRLLIKNKTGITTGCKATIQYENNYHHFVYNYYDKAGRQITEVQPMTDDLATGGELYGSNPAYWRMSKTEYHAWYPLRTDMHDEGTTLYIHGPDGKVRFTQDNEQYEKNICTYINYDPVSSKVTETGILDLTLMGLQFAHEGTYAAVTSGKTGYVNYRAETQANIPSSAFISERMITLFDQPDPELATVMAQATSNNGTWINRFKQRFVMANVSATQYIAGLPANTSSNPTATLGNTKTWYSYDEMGRMEWTVQRIDMGNYTKVSTIEYQYDLWGNVIWIGHNQPFASSQRSYHRYTYDLDSRMLRAEFSIDGTRWREEAQYDYYLHGPVKRQELAETLQGIDYTYTTAGGLKSINNAWLAQDPGRDGTAFAGQAGAHPLFAPDVFGTTLDYYAGDYTRAGTNIALNNTGSKWTGLVVAERWSRRDPETLNGAVPVVMQMKKYTYDSEAQLTQSVYGLFEFDQVQSKWAFTPNGNSNYSESFTYDRNGNLQTLFRNDAPTTTGTILTNATDNLTYTYDATTGKRNRLLRIQDATTSTNDGKRGDLKNQTNSVNYFYNAGGKVIADLAEGVYYVYNGRGEITEAWNVVVNSGVPSKGTRLKERYYYDDGGKRLMHETWTWFTDDNGNTYPTSAVRIWYIRDFGGSVLDVCEQTWQRTTSSTTPAFIGAPVLKENCLYANSRIGVFRRTGTTTGTETSYELTDHLGNVRAVIRRQKDSNGFVVTEQLTDYFAHGWAMPGRDRLLTSNEYRFAYQGIEQDLSTGNHFFTLRTYDARTARWTNPDPMMQYYSPYLAMDNNPVSMIDPTGGESGLSFTMDPVAFGFSALSMAAGALLSSGGNDAGSNAGSNAGAAPGFDPDDTRFLVPDAAGAAATAQVVAPEAYIIGGLLQANVAAVAPGPPLKFLWKIGSLFIGRKGLQCRPGIRPFKESKTKIVNLIFYKEKTVHRMRSIKVDLRVRDGSARDVVIPTVGGGSIRIKWFNDYGLSDQLLIEDGRLGSVGTDPQNQNTGDDAYSSFPNGEGPDRQVGANGTVINRGSDIVQEQMVTVPGARTRIRVRPNVNGSTGTTIYDAEVRYVYPQSKTKHREWLFGFIPLFWKWNNGTGWGGFRPTADPKAGWK